MKRLIFIALALTLALGMVLVPSVGAVEPIPITIYKTIPAGGPVEDFTFEAWRDLNNNGVIDGDDFLVGQVVITGAGTGVIYSTVKGPTIIHEVLIPGSAYHQLPDQIVQVSCEVEVTFENEVQVQEVGQILILKEDGEGNALAGATFEISPDPTTGSGSLTVVDNGANDELPLDDGRLLVTGCLVCVECNVTETDAPEGYELDPTPQTAHVTTAGETVELTFVNTEETCELTIYKVDGSANALAGATFVITPDPRTGVTGSSLTVVDNGLNDECAADGVLCLSELICGLTCTVEETVVPDGYEGAELQTVTIGETLELTFVNTEETCELTIYKEDGSGNALAGACFEITPDPTTGTGVMTVCDNGPNDECAADGVLCLSELICGLTCTVEETVVPDGYEGAEPQTVTIGETLELTFVNTPLELSCETVCAAQTQPSEYLFGGRQHNWFTYITYNKGDGTAGAPYEYPIYTGKTTLCGTLYVYDDGAHIFVDYVLTDTDTCTLAGLGEYHLQVDNTFADLKSHIVNRGGNPVPGKCTYKDTLDPMQPATGWIECTEDDISGWSDPIYIFAHGVGCYYCP